MVKGPAVSWACWGWLILLLASSLMNAQTPPPLGGEFQVNTVNTPTSLDQKSPSVSGNPSSEFIVSWIHNSRGGEVRAKIFYSAGSKQGPELVVYPCGYFCYGVSRTEALAQPTGEFVVVWSTEGNYYAGATYGKRIDNSGSDMTDFTVVNYGGWGASHLGNIDGDSNGDFVVVHSQCSAAYPWGCYPYDYHFIVERRFDKDGLRKDGASFGTDKSDSRPDVAVVPDGRFIVVWQSHDDGDQAGIFGRRFDADAQPLGDQFSVNENIARNQENPSIAATDAGEFLVVWQSDTSLGDDDDGTSIQGRWFDESAIPLGPDFQVNRFYPKNQTQPVVDLDIDGRAIVVWQHETHAGDIDILAKRFPAFDTPSGPVFWVNTTTEGDQTHPSLSTIGDHDFVVVWEGPGVGDGTVIFGQRFDGAFLFADSFGSGDTSTWSSTVD